MLLAAPNSARTVTPSNVSRCHYCRSISQTRSSNCSATIRRTTLCCSSSVRCQSGGIAIDAVGPDQQFKRTSLDPSQGRQCMVGVTHVDSPSSFWIQRKDLDHSVALEDLMDLME